MDEQPKKRPWFQFHLSTAIVLMFVAAGLLWLNLIVRGSPHWLLGGANMADMPCPFAYGFPVPFYIEPDFPFYRHWDPRSLVLDILFACGVLAIAWIACESAIRRKSANAEPPKDGQHL